MSITSPMASSRLKNVSRQEKILGIRSIGFKSLVLPFSQLKQVLRKTYFIFISEVFNEESSSVSFVSVRSESTSGCYRELRRQECPTRREQSDFSLFAFIASGTIIVVPNLLILLFWTSCDVFLTSKSGLTDVSTEVFEANCDILCVRWSSWNPDDLVRVKRIVRF